MKNKSELITELVQEHGYDQSEMESKTVKQLKELLSSTPDFGEIIEEEEELLIPETQENDYDEPSRFSEEWQDFIMSKFKDNELIDDKPTIDGLRRVCGNYGPGVMVESRPLELIQTGPHEFACNYIIKFEGMTDPEFSVKGIKTSQITYGGIGHASLDNVPDQNFAVYAPSIAETRAESRALRKALNIATVSADEVKPTEVITQNSEDDETKAMTKSQQIAIDSAVKRKRLEVKVDENQEEAFVINENVLTLNSELNENYSYLDAVKLVKELNRE